MKKDDGKFPFKMYAASGEGRIKKLGISEHSMEIIEVLSGNLEIRVGTELLSAAPGDFVYIPPKMVCSADSVCGEASMRAMVFDSSIIEANMQNFDSEIFYMFGVQAGNKISVFKPDHPVYNTLKMYMNESYDEYLAKDVCYKLPIRANIYLIMTALLRYYCGSKDESDRMVYHNVLRLRPVITYISEHYCEKIYVEKLSDMINVSPDYFTKMFKSSIGKTPIEYINGLRVNKAMELLYSTKKSMAEIADEIGFCNPNYFHKIFKQYIDQSPLAYRKASL